MGDLDCRIVAMLALALSLLSLSGVIFVRHHHNAYYHTPEAFVTERECLECHSTSSSDSGTSDGDDGKGLENSSPTNSIATPLYESNETSSHGISGGSGSGGAFVVSEACLQCICEASTGCLPVKCSSGLDCGIFRISQPYWIDAGSPTVRGGIHVKESPTNSQRAYLQCVNNPFCAARAVEKYIARYIRDCDGDGTIDCYDYAAIHIQGPTGCKLDDISPIIFSRLYRCLNDLTVKTREGA